MAVESPVSQRLTVTALLSRHLDVKVRRWLVVVLGLEVVVLVSLSATVLTQTVVGIGFDSSLQEEPASGRSCGAASSSSCAAVRCLVRR